MKIEKISENQIRCTLYNSDLASRELKISELAYGTEKAKSLFHDMIEQADEEFGFKASDAPLMIEAIPISTDCIVLIITKVDNPDELDEKFSKFAPPTIEPVSDEYDDTDFVSLGHLMGGALGSSKVKDKQPASNNPKDFVPMSETLTKDSKSNESGTKNPCRIFYFSSWDEASKAAEKVSACLTAGLDSSLFKKSDEEYILFLTDMQPEANGQFTRICHIMSDYARSKAVVPETLFYLKEHCRILVAHDALTVLTEY